MPPKLTVALILEGDLDATVDGHPLSMSARNGPAGYLWVNYKTVRLDRWIRAGQRVRKVTISMLLETLTTLIGAQELSRSWGLPGTDQGLAIMRWQPSARALLHAEEILVPENDGTGLDTLRSSIAALSLVRQALLHRTENALSSHPQINTRDANRARRAREYILGHIDQDLSIDEIAHGSAMSVSTLQRIFKSCFGNTVMEFVRVRRLELARLSLLDDGLTVGEAAYRAGYSSTASFSTAFQREFGYPPSTCIRD